MSERVPVPLELTPEAYLEAERAADERHEYVAGRIYALAGAKAAHGRIVANLARLLGNHLDGSPCEPYAGDVKLRAGTHVFYYPDLMVCCEPIPDDADYTDHARVVVEVASPSTRRIDEGEKAFAYGRMPSVEDYVLIEQGAMQVRVLRKGPDGWLTETLTQPTDLLRLDSLAFAAPLSAVYARTEAGR